VQVPGNQPRNLTLPEITGRKEVGAKLKCLPGTWSGNPTPVFTYQWLVGGSEIPAATGESYTVIAAQQGLVISCRVTATNPEGSASAESNGVSVPGIKPESVEAPQVSGSPVVGSSLKCGPGLWNGKPPPTFSFQWLRDGVAIAAATAQTYTVELADQGHSLSCTVRATNGEGSAEAHSSNALAVPVPVVLNEPKHELVVPLVTPPPTASEIQHTLRVQLARMLHHVHLASLRKSASFVFPFVAPSAGKLELFWYQANNSASQASGRQVVLALATSSFSGVGAKNVKLVLTAVARRMLRATKRVPLSFKGVFMLPGAPRVTWSGSYLLSH
jgi:hypothetical protein